MKTASSVVIARPNTHPHTVPHLKAVATEEQITITSLAHAPSFLEHSSEWIDVLKKNQKKFQATTLVTTMRTMVTHLKKAKKKKLPNGTEMNTPDLKKTIISVSEAGLVLSNEHFPDKTEDEWVLDMMPLPYNYKVKMAGKDFTFTESVVVWRGYIANTSVDVDEGNTPATSGNDGMSTLEKLMQGTTI